MAKKKSKAKQVGTDAFTPSNRTNVEMEKVKNGYVVSTFGANGSTKYIEKTKKAAKDRAAKLLG